MNAGMPSWISGSISGSTCSPRSSRTACSSMLGVELEPDRGDVPRLLLAEQVARAADLEVVRREAEAAAQVVELLQDAQPLLGVGGDEMLARNQQVGVRPVMRPADAAAELVELRQTEGVGAVHDDRVGASGCRAPTR